MFKIKKYWYVSYQFTNGDGGWGFGAASISTGLNWIAVKELQNMIKRKHPTFKHVVVMSWQRMNKKQHDEHKVTDE